LLGTSVSISAVSFAQRPFELKPDLELLRGKHILIVEDEFLVAERTRRELEKHGARIVGPVATVDLALDLLDETMIDAAILDINLDGETVYPLADILVERNIPFVFATGYETSTMPEKYRGFILCEKPTELAVIAIALFAPDRLCH
jgi:CheY-like chemotaxis protein